MIVIVNVTDPNIDPPPEMDDYEVRINTKVMATFKHKRALWGLPACLKLAANAVQETIDKDLERILGDKP